MKIANIVSSVKYAKYIGHADYQSCDFTLGYYKADRILTVTKYVNGLKFIDEM